MGYIAPWEQMLDISNVNGNLYTHLLYSYLEIGEDGKIIVYSPDDLTKLKNLAIKYPNLKILPSVGDIYTTGMFELLNTDALIQTFASSCKTVIEQYGLHGIDINWDYPSASNKARYGNILKILRQTLGPNLLITSKVSTIVENFAGFDEVAMNNYVDYVMLMTYDIHDSRKEMFTGHSTPLFGSGSDTIKARTDEWIKKGLRSDKIVIGLAFYGITWTLKNSNNIGIGAVSIGTGYGTSGKLAWNDMYIEAWDTYWDDIAKVPYAVIERQWMSYDNETSLEVKIEWMCQNNYQGVMINDIGMENTQKLSEFVQNAVNYYCGEVTTVTNPPLTTTEEWYTPTSTIVTNPSLTTTDEWYTPTTTESNYNCTDTDTMCNGQLLAKYPPDCNKYVDCRAIDRPVMSCPPDLQFDEANQYCDYEKNVHCIPCETSHI
ncbi:unnamed protein product [Gordionus sp. m RMFG-2023]